MELKNVRIIAIVSATLAVALIAAVLIFTSGISGGGLSDIGFSGDRLTGDKLSGKYMCINDKVPLHWEYLHDGYVEFSGRNEFKAYNLYDMGSHQGTYTIDGNNITFEYPVYREGESHSNHLTSYTVTINDDRSEISFYGVCIYKK
jgi:hypothetical protein